MPALLNREDDVGVLSALLAYIDQGTTVDAGRQVLNDMAAYGDEERQTLERKRLFLSEPLVMGLSADLPEPESYLTREELGVPVLLTRDQKGGVRAFLNVCRHRGARLVPPGRGRRALFSCPFHAWSYDGTGALVQVPHEEKFGCVEKAGHGLVELPAVERHGLIWSRLDAEPFDIDAHLGTLGAELARWDLGSATRVGARDLSAPINWKLAIDTFGETYHFEVLHRNSVNLSIVGGVQTYEIFGRHHRMVFAYRTIESLRGKPEKSWCLREHVLIAYFLFPNVQLLLRPTGVDLFRIFPGESVGQSVTDYTLYREKKMPRPSLVPDGEGALDLVAAVIRDEDYQVAQSSQSAASAGAFAPVQQHAIFGRNEPALHHYHNTFREALGMPPLKEPGSAILAAD